MRTNLNTLKQTYEDFLKESLYEDCTCKVITNEKGAERGNASLTIDIKSGDNSLSTSIYIIEKTLASGRESTAVIFVNNSNHAVIWNKISQNPMEKMADYVKTYIERSVKRMKGLPVETLHKANKTESAPEAPAGNTAE